MTMTMGECFIVFCKFIATVIVIWAAVCIFYRGPALIEEIKDICDDIAYATKEAINEWKELLFGKDEDNGC